MLKDDCLFCKIASGEIPSEKVYEDELFCAFEDLGPATPGHTLILPKAHFKDVTELDGEYSEKILKLAAKIGTAMKNGLGCEGFNLVQNNGEAAGQTQMHFHMHVIPRYGNEKEMIMWEPTSPTKEQISESADKIRAAL